MTVNLGINKKISIIFVLFISGGLGFYSASAQDTNPNSDLEKTGFGARINEFDHLLNISVTAPLAALSLTGATFLTRPSKNESEDPRYTQLMQDAKKYLITSFVIFLACTIAIFFFDFIELVLTTSPVGVELLDLVITYALLFVGFGNLAVAARKMYLTRAK